MTSRCALHFATLDKREGVASLLSKFKKATVSVSDSIRSSLRIISKGRPIEGAVRRANFHLEEDKGALQLYLPKDDIERDVCLESDLPRKICTHLGIIDPVAPGVVGSVFRKHNPAVINKILENAGVGDVSFEASASEDASDMPGDILEAKISDLVEDSNDALGHESPAESVTSGDGTEGRSSTESGASEELLEGALEDTAEVVEDGSMDESLAVAASNSRIGQSSGISRTSRMPATAFGTNVSGRASLKAKGTEQELAYKQILGNVVTVARRRASLGILESAQDSFFDPPPDMDALPPAIIRRAFGVRSIERDFQVGAAGELYIFEFLKGCNLPAFGALNWKSEIRDRVNVHADYRSLEPYTYRGAVADLDYQDHSGKLTQFLIEKGLLVQDVWNKKTPQYYIEVKTTTSSNWQEPFFMSKAQEKHVRKAALIS